MNYWVEYKVYQANKEVHAGGRMLWLEDMAYAGDVLNEVPLVELSGNKLEEPASDVRIEVWRVERDIDGILLNPLTKEEIKEQQDENGYIEGVLAVQVSDIHDYSLEVATLVSNRFVGSPHLADVRWKIIGNIKNAENILRVQVAGYTHKLQLDDEVAVPPVEEKAFTVVRLERSTGQYLKAEAVTFDEEKAKAEVTRLMKKHGAIFVFAVAPTTNIIQ